MFAVRFLFVRQRFAGQTIAHLRSDTKFIWKSLLGKPRPVESMNNELSGDMIIWVKLLRSLHLKLRFIIYTS